MQVQMESKGDEQAARLLAGVAKRGMDMRPPLREISDALRLAEDPWFRTHGDDRWLPLADITRDEKARLGFPADPLVRTGALGYSLTSRGGRGAIRRTTKDAMRFGTSLRYAKYHAIGGSIPLRHPLVPVDAGTRKHMVDEIKRYALTGQVVKEPIR